MDLVVNHTSAQHPWFTEAVNYLKSLESGQEPNLEECPYVDYYHFTKDGADLSGYVPLEGTDYYSYFGLKENKLAWNKVLEFGQTMKEDYSVAMVRWWKKDHLSITKEEFEQEEKNDEKYLTRVELLTLEEVEECLQ